MEASELLQPLVAGTDYLTNGTRLVLVLGYIDSEDAYWTEDARGEVSDGVPLLEREGVGKVRRADIGEGRPWRVVDLG